MAKKENKMVNAFSVGQKYKSNDENSSGRVYEVKEITDRLVKLKAANMQMTMNLLPIQFDVWISAGRLTLQK